MRNGRWNKDETLFLLKHLHLSNKEIAKALDRTPNSVAYHKSWLGIRSEKFNGCDQDCFNCKYSDCLKPMIEGEKDDDE